MVPAQPQKKKEKPLVKTPIPGTDWIRVKTTEGNIFYSHKAEKRSVWTVPDEIKDAVEKLERDEEEQQRQEAVRKDEETRKAEEVKQQAIARMKAEAKGKAVKRKVEVVEETVEEVVISKKAKVDEDEDDEDAEGEEDSDEDSEMEDWQREAAAQLAAEAEEEKRRLEEAKKREEEEAKERAKAEAEAQQKKALNMPERVDLSLDEAKALFKVSSIQCHTCICCS